MTIFRRELKNNVKNEIIHDERNYESLAEFIKIVIDFNDRLYERIMKKRYDQSKDKAWLIYESTMKYVRSKKTISYIRNSEYTDPTLMKLDMIQRCKEKNFKNKKKSKKKLCYECEKTDHFIKNCRNENMISQQQLNITLKKVSETDDKKNIVNETKTLKISSNDKYYMINSITKLQKVIDAALDKTKRINFKIEKFRRSSTSHSKCIKEMFKSNLKYDYDDQTEQVINEMFKEFEIWINDLSNSKKKKQCTNHIVDIFERTLNSDISIKSCIKSIKEHSKLLNTT